MYSYSQVKDNCTENQQCSTMSCNVSSAALTCLHLAPLAEQVDSEEIWGEDENQNRRNKDLVPLWLGEILSNGYHPRIWMRTILKEDGLVECTIEQKKNTCHR